MGTPKWSRFVRLCAVLQVAVVSANGAPTTCNVTADGIALEFDCSSGALVSVSCRGVTRAAPGAGGLGLGLAQVRGLTPTGDAVTHAIPGGGGLCINRTLHAAQAAGAEAGLVRVSDCFAAAPGGSGWRRRT